MFAHPCPASFRSRTNRLKTKTIQTRTIAATPMTIQRAMAAIIESRGGGAYPANLRPRERLRRLPGSTSGYVSAGEKGEAQRHQSNRALSQVVAESREHEKDDSHDVENP